MGHLSSDCDTDRPTVGHTGRGFFFLFYQLQLIKFNTHDLPNEDETLECQPTSYALQKFHKYFSQLNFGFDCM